MLMDEFVETTSPLVELHEFRSYCFRGEGRANFVVSAKCEKSGLRIVWRLAKHRKSGTVTVKPKCHVVIAYLEKLIVPVLGRQYLIKPKVVQIDVDSLHHLAKCSSLVRVFRADKFDVFDSPFTTLGSTYGEDKTVAMRMRFELTRGNPMDY
ncbi:hypothetical protein Tcan_13243 [Toxocara canis]|uniref:Inositol-pentakisphosphate 2-kinase n=1 Tax=Toxocara canis TaxID=6265 RepID=A0A0B2W2Y1_TOXCA|nr:hypothetical protein Tcan_13243 [Toxocara canis]